MIIIMRRYRYPGFPLSVAMKAPPVRWFPPEEPAHAARCSRTPTSLVHINGRKGGRKGISSYSREIPPIPRAPRDLFHESDMAPCNPLSRTHRHISNGEHKGASRYRSRYFSPLPLYTSSHRHRKMSTPQFEPSRDYSTPSQSTLIYPSRPESLTTARTPRISISPRPTQGLRTKLPHTLSYTPFPRLALRDTTADNSPPSGQQTSTTAYSSQRPPDNDQRPT